MHSENPNNSQYNKPGICEESGESSPEKPRKEPNLIQGAYSPFWVPKNYLSTKYRKLIPNLKMKKSSQSCTFCQQKFVEDEIIKKFPCKHILHRDCAKLWLKKAKTCPICKLNLEEFFKSQQHRQIKHQEEEERQISITSKSQV